jgi:3-hydroxybutyryl-CoA dehydrogenase
MKIFARGEKIRLAAIQQHLTSLNAEWVVLDEHSKPPVHIDHFDLIIDLNLDEQDNSYLNQYATLKGKPVLVSAVKQNLAAMAANCTNPIDCLLIGVNALPTFIERAILEVSLYANSQKESAESFLQSISLPFAWVHDRIGMATPRVICMIINEACYTLQEGTATISDIDISMKLGTNYPMGPFEWANKIGITHVYEVLNAVYADTHDERYKICPLLKRQYLLKEPFVI